MINRKSPSEIEEDEALKALFEDWTLLFYITDTDNHAMFFQERIAILMELETAPVLIFINTGQSNLFVNERTEADEWSIPYLSGHLYPNLAKQFTRVKALGVPFAFSGQLGWSAQLQGQFQKLQKIVTSGRRITSIDSIKLFRVIWQRGWEYYSAVI